MLVYLSNKLCTVPSETFYIIESDRIRLFLCGLLTLFTFIKNSCIYLYTVYLINNMAPAVKK